MRFMDLGIRRGLLLGGVGTECSHGKHALSL